MMGSLGIYSQNEAAADSAGVTRVPRAEKKVPTRNVTGKVYNANAGQPLAGAMVRVSGMEGYSALTGEDGTFTLAVPLHATVLEVTAPDFNTVMAGLRGASEVQDIHLYLALLR